jgi:hypothetical protein
MRSYAALKNSNNVCGIDLQIPVAMANAKKEGPLPASALAASCIHAGAPRI